MTKTQFRKKVWSCKKDINKLIDEKIEKVLSSGCLDLTEYENNYRLPKYFLFGSDTYSKEELVAEIGNAYLCGLCGIDTEIDNHVAYIQNWLKSLKDDKTMLIKANSQATKALDFLIPTVNPEIEPPKPDKSEPEKDKIELAKPEIIKPEIIKPIEPEKPVSIKPVQTENEPEIASGTDFICEIALAKKHVTNLSRIVNNSSSLPVIKCLKITGTKNKIQLDITNFEEQYSCDFKSDNQADFEILIDFKKFHEAIKNVKRKYLCFNGIKNADYYTINPSQIELDEFPIYWDFKSDTQTNKIELDKDFMQKKFNYAWKFASNGVTGRVLCGVCFDKGNLVATDGKRLYYEAHNCKVEKPFVIPQTKFTKSIKEKVSITTYGTETPYIEIVSSNYTYTGKLVDGLYPNYKKVIPPSHEHKIQLSQAHISEIRSLIKANIKIADGTDYIKFDIQADKINIKFADGLLTLFNTESSFIGLISFTPFFLNQFLEYENFELYMFLNDGFSPISFSSTQYNTGIFGIIMPIRNK